MEQGRRWKRTVGHVSIFVGVVLLLAIGAMAVGLGAFNQFSVLLGVYGVLSILIGVLLVTR